MNDLSRLKELAGVSNQLNESAADEAAQKAHHWVETDLSEDQMYSAIWGLFMQFQPNELQRLHYQFRKEESGMHESDDFDPVDTDERPVYTDADGNETRHLPSEINDIYPPRGDIEMDPNERVRPKPRPTSAPAKSIRPKPRP